MKSRYVMDAHYLFIYYYFFEGQGIRTQEHNFKVSVELLLGQVYNHILEVIYTSA